MYSTVLNYDSLSDETDAISPALRAELIYQGMIYLTEFSLEGDETEDIPDTIQNGALIARSLEHANIRAKERSYGERVIGAISAQKTT